MERYLRLTIVVIVETTDGEVFEVDDCGDCRNDWKKKSDNEARAFQVSNYDQGQKSSSTQLSFTSQQIDKLLKFLESTPSGFITQKGTFFSVSLNHTCIVDSGATDHMTD